MTAVSACYWRHSVWRCASARFHKDDVIDLCPQCFAWRSSCSLCISHDLILYATIGVDVSHTQKRQQFGKSIVKQWHTHRASKWSTNEIVEVNAPLVVGGVCVIVHLMLIHFFGKVRHVAYKMKRCRPTPESIAIVQCKQWMTLTDDRWQICHAATYINRSGVWL